MPAVNGGSVPARECSPCSDGSCLREREYITAAELGSAVSRTQRDADEQTQLNHGTIVGSPSGFSGIGGAGGVSRDRQGPTFGNVPEKHRKLAKNYSYITHAAACKEHAHI